jgi:glycine cleavage system aminomethyltransferase T
MIRGLMFDGEACPTCQIPWTVTVDGTKAGYVTSAIWSPRFERNVALAMVDKAYWQAGRKVVVESCDGLSRNGLVTKLPMPDGVTI